MTAQSKHTHGAARGAVALFAGVMLAGCGGGNEWQSFSDPSGSWVLESPGEMEFSSGTQDGLQFDVWTYESGDDGYSVSQVTLPPDAPFALDAAVDGSVEAMRADIEAQTGESGTAEIVELEAGLFLDSEERSYTAVMRFGDRTIVAKGRVFVAAGVLNQLVAIDDGDDDRDDIDRFLGSLTEA